MTIYSDPKFQYSMVGGQVSANFYKTIVVVGQSTATQGGYLDIQFKTEQEINALFGEGQYLTTLLQDIRRSFASSLFKPVVHAVSYEDVNSHHAKTLNIETTGTATEAKTLQIKINYNNADRLVSQIISALSLRATYSSDCSKVVKPKRGFNGSQVFLGSPKNISMPFNPILYYNDFNNTLIEVAIEVGDDADAITLKINEAINAVASCVFSSDNQNDVATLTAKNKGLVTQGYTIEIVDNTIPSGVTFNIESTQAGTGTPTITDLLDVVMGTKKLSELDFDFLQIPHGYSLTNIKTDAFAKSEGVSDYNNQPLDYHIFTGKSVDLSNDTELTSLTSTYPIETAGINISFFVIEKQGFTNKGITAIGKKNKVAQKQFSVIQEELDGSLSVGDTFTLSSEVSYVELKEKLVYYANRDFIISNSSEFFAESNYTDANIAPNVFTKTKQEIKDYYLGNKGLFEILTGEYIDDEVYTNKLAGLCDTSEELAELRGQIFDATFNFDESSRQVSFVLQVDAVKSIKVVSIVQVNK